jgi:hypothetical protein
MTHPKRAKQKPEPEIELRPDGWERFERAVGRRQRVDR